MTRKRGEKFEDTKAVIRSDKLKKERPIKGCYKRARAAQCVRWLDYLATHASLSPIRVGSRPAFYITKKVHSTRLASDKVYQFLAHGRWFSPGTPAFSTTKTGHHDIVKILLKVALNHNKSINIISLVTHQVISHE